MFSDSTMLPSLSTIELDTPQFATGNTSFLFTNIPKQTKRVSVMFHNIRTNGNSPGLIRLGSGSVLNTGYNTASLAGPAAVSAQASTVGFVICGVNSGRNTSGSFMITSMGNGTWVAGGAFTSSLITLAAGSVAIGGTLDHVQITTVSGNVSFVGGSVNLAYE